MASTEKPGPHVHSVNPTMRVMSLVIPGFLAVSVGYVLYAVPSYILFDQFHTQYHDTSLAIGLLVTYIVIATLMVASYLRLFITIRTNPGVTALGPEAARAFYGPSTARTKAKSGATCCNSSAKKSASGSLDNHKSDSTGSADYDSGHGIDLESGLVATPPYGSTPGGFGAAPFGLDPRLDPDSPGLELFYTKDIFECSPDGRPIFCGPCGTWKPDRTHHCSEVDRCVRKMDHFCPWVGGIISENTFKFFLQFTYYATILCGLTIGISAYALWRRNHLNYSTDARIVTALALGGFLGLFSFSMAATCSRFVFTNVTSVEVHQLKSRTKTMAVRIKQGSEPINGLYDVVTYPLPKNDDSQQIARPQEPKFTRRGDGDSDPDPFVALREARAARRAARDLLAYRTFAIVHVKMGINVWDLGWRANWNSVMGTNIFDWLLPLRSSPCCDHESTSSFYPLSAEFHQICADLKLPAYQD